MRLSLEDKAKSKTDKLYIAPGNAGTAAIGTNVAIPATDFDAIGKFAVENISIWSLWAPKTHW